MTLIAEDLLLLLLKDDTGKPMIDATRLDRVLAGGLLVELAIHERVTPAVGGESARTGRLVVRDSGSTGDELLDRALQRLASGKPVKPEKAVERLCKGLRQELLSRLAAGGHLREQRGRALGIFPTRSWPAIDPTQESELRAELTRVLVGGEDPAVRTAALISLLAAVDAAAKVLAVVDTAGDRRAVKRRAKDIAAGDWAGAAVRKAVDAVNAAVVGAVVATTAATSASG